MHFSSLVSVLLAGSTIASPGRYRPFDGLTVDLSGPPDTVNSVDDLQFFATVKNHGAQAVKILKYGTILDDGLPTRSFTITRDDGVVVPFTGAKISLSLTNLDDSAFTTIPAFKNVTVHHDISSLFDFSELGTGTYFFTPITNFRVMTSLQQFAGTPVFRNVNVDTNTMVITVADDVLIRTRAIPENDRRAVDRCLNPSKKASVDASYKEGKVLAKNAIAYLQANTTQANETDLLYTSYWGNTPTYEVISVLHSVAQENSTYRSLSCVDAYDACSSGVVAYTVISTTNIYFCDLFFKQLPTDSLCTGNATVSSRTIRGGTTLHELTHAVADTEDIAYGCAANQALPDSLAVINADSYNCFATQVWANTQC